MAVRSSQDTGYTLIELMVVLAIAAILLTLVVPFFQTQVSNARMSAATSNFLSTFMSARSEASARSNFVTVCKRNADGDGCVATAADDWTLGWITFVDDNGDGVRDPGDEIIQIHEPLPAPLRAKGQDQLVTEHRITYRPNGQTNLDSTSKIVVCYDNDINNQTQPKAIVVSMLGKASILPAKNAGATSC